MTSQEKLSLPQILRKTFMKLNLKLFISYLIIAVASPQVIYGMEGSDHEVTARTQEFKRLPTIPYFSPNVWSEMETNLDKTAEAGEAFQRGIYNLKIQFEELKTKFEESQEQLGIANHTIESLNEQLKASIREIDALKAREVIAQKLEPEEQKRQRIKIQEIEKTWNFRINNTLEYIRVLQRNDLTYKE